MPGAWAQALGHPDSCHVVSCAWQGCSARLARGLPVRQAGHLVALSPTCSIRTGAKAVFHHEHLLCEVMGCMQRKLVVLVSLPGDFSLLKLEIWHLGCGRQLTWRGSGVHLLDINPAIGSRQDYGAINSLGHGLASRRGVHHHKKARKGTGQGDLGPMNRRSHVFYSLVRNGFY